MAGPRSRQGSPSCSSVRGWVLQLRMSRATSELSEEEEVLARKAEDTWFRAAHERRIAHLKADIDWLQTVLSRESGVIRARRRRVRRAVG